MKVTRIKIYPNYAVATFAEYNPIYFTIENQKPKKFFFIPAGEGHIDITPILCKEVKKTIFLALREELNK